ncbi:hypothetical protein [uncultured Wocania sp.]|uniref:hypothetical protein n=1 Tax=uncultured Wocania sp. TaxID=2834404 RepID=UPI0030F861BE
MSQFEKLGYFIDYIIDDKYIGSITMEKPDRETIGYYGKITEVAIEDIIFSNKKRIKKGQTFYTIMYPLCGKLIKKQ